MNVSESYELLKSLGVGATSEVFHALNRSSGQEVALKVFSSLVLSDPEAVRRLEAEAEILRSLKHPNIVGLHRTFRADRQFSLELELVNGMDLRKWSQENPLDLLEPRFWILSQVARGLGGAHERGILHRDLKPENILVSDEGQVKLTDFGLARSITRVTVTRMGLLVGSLGYLAPEVIDGQKATERSDIFSFGVVAYELLCGQSPFAADTPQGLIHNVATGVFVSLRERNPSIPEDVVECIDACLAKKSESRPESIWSVEASFMNALMRSKLLHLAPLLVAKNHRDTVVSEAYQIKSRALNEQIAQMKEQYLANRALSTRRRIMALANEMQRLFPNDPSPIEFLRDLEQPVKGHRLGRQRVLVAIVGLVLFLGLGIFFLWGEFWTAQIGAGPVAAEGKGARTAPSHVNSLADGPPTVETASVPKAIGGDLALRGPSLRNVEPETGGREDFGRVEKPTVTETKKIESSGSPVVPSARVPLVLPPKTPRPKTEEASVGRPPKPPQGYLKFEVDDDVEVFVDGIKVPISRYAHFAVPVGVREIRLVKRGYMPITSRVSVLADKESLIRVKEGG